MMTTAVLPSHVLLAVWANATALLLDLRYATDTEMRATGFAGIGHLFQGGLRVSAARYSNM